MNILIFSWRALGHPHAGGAEKVTFNHAKAWVKAGHKVTIFSSSFNNSKKNEVIEGVEILRSGDEIFGVRVNAFFWYLSSSSRRYDLVVDEVHGLPFFTPIFVRVPKMVFIHEVAKEVWILNPWPKPFNLIPAFFGFFLEPFIYKIFYKKIKFLTVSKSTKDDLVGWGIPKENINIIQNGLDINKPKKIFQKQKKTTLIFLGSLSKDKGIEDAIKCFSKLSSLNKDWQFWIIGKSDSSYLNYLKNLAKRFNVSNHIKFWGFVNENKKVELLSKSHLLINPSIREGWGLNVIEAASLGVPTVGYNVPGLKDSIVNNKTGYLSSPNPEDLSIKTLRLINDQATYKRFQTNCIDWSKKFNWGISTKKSLTLIKKITQ